MMRQNEDDRPEGNKLITITITIVGLYVLYRFVLLLINIYQDTAY